jgi:hypothetical protein
MKIFFFTNLLMLVFSNRLLFIIWFIIECFFNTDINQSLFQLFSISLAFQLIELFNYFVLTVGISLVGSLTHKPGYTWLVHPIPVNRFSIFLRLIQILHVPELVFIHTREAKIYVFIIFLINVYLKYKCATECIIDTSRFLHCT